MRTIRQKFTSFILMFAMLLLGLCYGSTQADSSLMYENSDFSEISQQLSSETSERMVSANAYLRQEGRRITTRTSRALNCLFLIVELLSQMLPVIFACSILSLAYHTPCRDIIIRYIHNKDGKKNN